MEVIYTDRNKQRYCFAQHTGVGLGNFDGLHLGHMALINTLISECRFDGLKSVIYTFTKHPGNIIRKKLFKPLITTVRKKEELLHETNLDYVYFDEFDENYSRMRPETFVKEVLHDCLNAKLVVAGFNYRFGYKGEGDADELRRICSKYGIRVITIPPVKIDDQIVSSSLIREYIKKGCMDQVFKLLGRHFSLTGEVKQGRKIGSRIGFPTANIIPENYLIMPKRGVYATKTLVNDKLMPSVTNVGFNPTFGELKQISIETHILDFDENIYDKNIEVFFIKKLRNERKFNSPDELIEQVKKDIQAAKKYFSHL